MKRLTLDFQHKTIQIGEEANLQELIERLMELELDFSKWRVISTIEYIPMYDSPSTITTYPDPPFYPTTTKIKF